MMLWSFSHLYHQTIPKTPYSGFYLKKNVQVVTTREIFEQK